MKDYLSDEQIYHAVAGDDGSILLLLKYYDKYINQFCKKGYTNKSEADYYIDTDKKSTIITAILSAVSMF